jgi:hypothetical protein
MFAARQVTVIALFGLVAAAVAQEKPLPNVEALRTRALEENRSTEALRERYLCRVKVETTELDSKGNAKKTEVDERELFFVKGRQISQTVTKNGKPLPPDDAKKEVDRVKKQIENAEKGKDDPNSISQTAILRIFKLSNERRVTVNGRPTIVFDGAGDPRAKANGMIERAVQAMEGTVAVDEASGRVQDTNVHGVRDVKLAGGLVANLHKGFLLHVVTAPRNDGVWLVQEVWGSGDARVGLFMHPFYRYHQVTEGCRLFNVSTEAVEALETQH